MNPGLKEFYKNKKVFITGHTGFKGTWLSLWLKIMGAEVCGFSLDPPGDINFFELSKMSQDILSLYGDVRDLNALKKAVLDFKPDIIIHMAAQSLVKHSYEDPVKTYSTNIMGTVNLLETVRFEDKIGAVLNVTSDKCYENKEWIWGYRESDPMGGFDPYSSSKACSEIITSAYTCSFFNSDSEARNNTPIASARAGNVIGGGDFAADRLIPDLVRAYLKDEKVHIRNPNAIRPWQHVFDPLAGYLLLVSKLYVNGFEFSGAWNFGPESMDVKNVGYIVDKFTTMCGDNPGWTADDTSFPHEANLLKLDCSKSQGLLGWKARLDIEQALEWTVDWYKIFKDEPNKLYEFSEKQIKTYERLLNEIY